MEIHPVKSEADYQAALDEIDAIFQAEPDTPDGDRLDVLVTLVMEYEKRNFPVDPPDPIEAIRFRMEQMGLTRKDLEPMIGARGRVSEVLSGRRALSLTMIRKLCAGLNIPADVLIRPPGKPKKARILG